MFTLAAAFFFCLSYNRSSFSIFPDFSTDGFSLLITVWVILCKAIFILFIDWPTLPQGQGNLDYPTHPVNFLCQRKPEYPENTTAVSAERWLILLTLGLHIEKVFIIDYYDLRTWIQFVNVTHIIISLLTICKRKQLKLSSVSSIIWNNFR